MHDFTPNYLPAPSCDYYFARLRCVCEVFKKKEERENDTEGLCICCFIKLLFY